MDDEVRQFFKKRAEAQADEYDKWLAELPQALDDALTDDARAILVERGYPAEGTIADKLRWSAGQIEGPIYLYKRA